MADEHIIVNIKYLLPGSDGVDGQDGAPGPQGLPGSDGVDGQDGAPGPQGLPGADGADGQDGAPGPQGLPGADGADGQDGAPGPQGLPGSDGADADSEAVAQNTNRINQLEQNSIQSSELALIQEALGALSEHFLADNPHGISALSLGVYTASQVDSIIQQAITSAVAQASFAANDQVVFDGQATSSISLIFNGQAA